MFKIIYFIISALWIAWFGFVFFVVAGSTGYQILIFFLMLLPIPIYYILKGFIIGSKKVAKQSKYILIIVVLGIIAFVLWKETDIFTKNCKGVDFKQWTNCQGIYTFTNKDSNYLIGKRMRTMIESTYVGEWKDGLPHGQGTQTGVWGEYVGEFKNDKSTQGTVTWANGDKYVGGFDNKSLFHGQGTFTMIDGTIEKGIWQHGVLVEPN
jgi:hypothetical protein